MIFYTNKCVFLRPAALLALPSSTVRLARLSSGFYTPQDLHALLLKEAEFVRPCSSDWCEVSCSASASSGL